MPFNQANNSLTTESSSHIEPISSQAGGVDTGLSGGYGRGDGRHLARRLQRIILEQSYRARVGHIGSSLSVCHILAALYSGCCLRIDSPDDPERDRFVLSKGHAALALYAAIYTRGWISEEQLYSFCGNGTALGVHPEHKVQGVDFATGSLGHGLSYGAGAALAARKQRSNRRIFVLLSDAECNEGSVWEAIMFAAHHQLSNLIAIVDMNGQQAFGYTRDVLDMGGLPGMAERWQSFGWDTRTVDGHDVQGLIDTIGGIDALTGPPHVLLARTTFGKGVSFMENSIKWHYSPMSESEYVQALSALETAQ